MSAAKTSELAHIFRNLKAPAAARAMSKLAERAREEPWSHERFLEAVPRRRGADQGREVSFAKDA